MIQTYTRLLVQGLGSGPRSTNLGLVENVNPLPLFKFTKVEAPAVVRISSTLASKGFVSSREVADEEI